MTRQGRRVIGINHPYTEGALSFVVKDIDIAPLFIIQDSSGKEIDGAYIKLRNLGKKEGIELVRVEASSGKKS